MHVYCRLMRTRRTKLNWTLWQAHFVGSIQHDIVLTFGPLPFQLMAGRVAAVFFLLYLRDSWHQCVVKFKYYLRAHCHDIIIIYITIMKNISQPQSPTAHHFHQLRIRATYERSVSCRPPHRDQRGTLYTNTHVLRISIYKYNTTE